MDERERGYTRSYLSLGAQPLVALRASAREKGGSVGEGGGANVGPVIVSALILDQFTGYTRVSPSYPRALSPRATASSISSTYTHHLLPPVYARVI